MSTINNSTAPGATYLSSTSAMGNEDFDQKVLEYLEQNKPEGTLSEIMEKMRALSPDKDVTMQQLNEALLYADMTLRNNGSTDYTDAVLDKCCTQLQCLNMLVNDMMQNGFKTTDDDTDSNIF